MDLNLYLGLPYSPQPRSRDLGSDLSLSSLPMSTSNSTSIVEESVSPVVMPSSVELTEPQTASFRSHPEYTPDLPAPTTEYNPYFPSYESYRASLIPISVALSELEGPSTLYSPPIVQPSPAVEELQETETQVVESDLPYDPVSLPRLASESMPYSPPYVSRSAIPPDQEDANFSLFSPIHEQLDDLIAAEDRFPLMPEHIRSPQSRFRRLIESTNRWPIRRFRSSLAHAGERSSFGSPSSLNPEQQVLHDARSPERVCETNASNKVPSEDNVVEASEEKRDKKDKIAANFECNICLDTATEPVVTSCGHLFCWPCLYKWLHVHSDHNECPVCKGEVTEGKITPIYGRGNSSTEEKIEDPESGLKIPPRPRGSRVESFRQQFQPAARRFSEGIASWRRLIDYHMRSRNRYGPPPDPTQQELIDIHHRSLSRLRARRLQRDVNPQNATDNGEFGLPPSSSNIQNPASTNANSVFQEFLHPLSLHGLGTERLAVVTAGIGRMFEQFASSSHRYGASTSAEPPAPEPPRSEPHASATLAADQISASSTMAVIQGDNATSYAMPDPNSAGTSRSHRRRGRSSSSGSFDVDGGNLHPFKRRRLN